MREARSQAVPSGTRIEIFDDDAQLSFRDFLVLLGDNSDFASWYSELIAGCEFEAFFWELPPLTTETIENGAEFVIIESASLATLRPDPIPFQSHFSDQQGLDVIEFSNLGGDALLVVPTPIGSLDSYAHLAAFLRTAPREQVVSLWRVAASMVFENLGSAPNGLVRPVWECLGSIFASTRVQSTISSRLTKTQPLARRTIAMNYRVTFRLVGESSRSPGFRYNDCKNFDAVMESAPGAGATCGIRAPTGYLLREHSRSRFGGK